MEISTYKQKMAMKALSEWTLKAGIHDAVALANGDSHDLDPSMEVVIDDAEQQWLILLLPKTKMMVTKLTPRKCFFFFAFPGPCILSMLSFTVQCFISIRKCTFCFGPMVLSFVVIKRA